jgi:hypothetical protein
VDESPIQRLIDAIDHLDASAVAAMCAKDCKMLSVNGARANGIDAVKAMVAEYLAGLRSSHHRITAEWHLDNVWIAEMEATYELRDRLLMRDLPRAMFLRDGPDGFCDLRVYGAHERSILDRPTGEEGMWVGERWIPPL